LKPTFNSQQRVEERVRKLRDHLRRHEWPRWHPDRINVRTGNPGEVDDGIGARDEVKAVWVGVQRVGEEYERLLEK
jgi:hypothetical protein